ncbi:S-layer homology domain-containing protein [Caldanaerobacter subterraneus]|uniref:S-layer homology domain-containing protein n=1 Tax=Caldanaerobacter subterraneus TaxID=911092 RepID=UPI003463BA33
MRKRLIFFVVAVALVLAVSVPTIELKAQSNRPFVPVLMYHHLQKEGTFDSKKYGGVIVDPERFEKQMLYLKAAGYHTITLEELRNFVLYNKPLPPKPIVITFDDGYLSNYTYAYPVLKKLGMKAAINIIVSYVPDEVNKQKPSISVPHFTWEQAKEMADSGVIEIESHTYDLHGYRSNGFKKIPMVMGPVIINGHLETMEEYKQRLYTDFLRSREIIKEKIGKAPICLTYPFGAGNKISDEIARKVGFEMAFGIQEGVNYYGDNIMKLKRITVRDSDTGQDIVEKINKLSHGINFIPFWDIKGRQFEKDILKAIVKGIFAGYEDGSFKPEKPVTRAEFASLINKIFLKEKKVLEREVYFKDVPKNAWYYKAVVNVVNNEIMKGYEDNTFKPQKPVTWKEAVDVIKKFFDLNSLDKNMFKSPEKTLTREELAVLLDKIIKE